MNGQGGRNGNGQRGQGGRMQSGPGGYGQPGQFANGGELGTQQSGDGRPVLGNGELRQLRDQANQLANDLQGLRRQLQGANLDQPDLRNLEDVLNELRQMGVTADPQSIQSLTAAALEKLQKVEYNVRKKVDTDNQQLFLAGSDEVAPQFQKQVEDYFRELSNRRGTKGGGQ